MAQTIVYQTISTVNDSNGNSRILAIVSKLDDKYAERLDIIKFNNEGHWAVTKKYPTAVRLPEISVTPKEFNHWVKVGKNDEALRGE